MKKPTMYFRMENGQMNSRRWTNPPHGWHASKSAAIRDAVQWRKMMIKDYTKEIKQLEKLKEKK